jgi:threonine/homoserine efflux transporter RhtA
MMVAAVAVAPIGLADAAATFNRPELLAAGLGVGICSSVIPYVCDQLALARLSRATFALLLSLLPATATVIGLIVLAQRPGLGELLGIVLVIAGVAIHDAGKSELPAQFVDGERSIVVAQVGQAGQVGRLPVDRAVGDQVPHAVPR